MVYTVNMSTGSHTLAEIASRLSTLEMRGTKCDRRGRYRIATLIECYGTDFDAPEGRQSCRRAVGGSSTAGGRRADRRVTSSAS